MCIYCLCVWHEFWENFQNLAENFSCYPCNRTDDTFSSKRPSKCELLTLCDIKSHKIHANFDNGYVTVTRQWSLINEWLHNWDQYCHPGINEKLQNHLFSCFEWISKLLPSEYITFSHLEAIHFNGGHYI